MTTVREYSRYDAHVDSFLSLQKRVARAGIESLRRARRFIPELNLETILSLPEGRYDAHVDSFLSAGLHGADD